MSLTSWLKNLRTATAPSVLEAASSRPRRDQSKRGPARSIRRATYRAKIEVLENRALLSFVPADYPVDTVIPSPDTVAADFTSDGIADLITSIDYGSKVKVEPGLGDGTYGDPIYTNTHGGPWAPAVDFNGDNRLDFVMITSSIFDFGEVGYVYLGRGDGTFDGPTGAFDVGLGQSIAVSAENFNDDGLPDLAIGYFDSEGNYSAFTMVNDGVWTSPPPPPPPLPTVSINDVSLKEGRNNTTTYYFTVTLSGFTTDTVTVNFATADGTATAGRDYVAKSGSVTFLPGETTKSVTISVTGDKTKEPDETFFVNLSGATNGQIADGQGVGTILNDDSGSTGGKKTSTATDFDAALDDLLNSPRKKRRT